MSNTDDELDEIKLMIHKLLKYNPKTPPDGHDYQLTDRLEQAIKDLIDKARIDELNKYNAHYGDDWDNYITDRLNQLKGDSNE